MPWVSRIMGLSCPVCGGELDAPGVCLACREKLVPNRVAGSVYLGRYARLRGLVQAVKYRQNRDALEWSAECLAAALAQTGWPVEGVVYVPTFFWRAALRGQYVPEALAASIARRLGLPVHRALRRRRYTPSQTRRKDRARLPQVFAALGPAPKRVLLVDDVLTSGATFRQAARALFEAGSEEVHGVFLAVADPGRLYRLPYNRAEARR